MPSRLDKSIFIYFSISHTAIAHCYHTPLSHSAFSLSSSTVPWSLHSNHCSKHYLSTINEKWWEQNLSLSLSHGLVDLLFSHWEAMLLYGSNICLPKHFFVYSWLWQARLQLKLMYFHFHFYLSVWLWLVTKASWSQLHDQLKRYH